MKFTSLKMVKITHEEGATDSIIMRDMGLAVQVEETCTLEDGESLVELFLMLDNDQGWRKPDWTRPNVIYRDYWDMTIRSNDIVWNEANGWWTVK